MRNVRDAFMCSTACTHTLMVYTVHIDTLGTDIAKC